MKRPEYVLDKDHSCIFYGDAVTLPKGSHVVPMDLRWVPQEIKEKHRFFVDSSDVYVYTKYGILPIPKSILRTIL